MTTTIGCHYYGSACLYIVLFIILSFTNFQKRINKYETITSLYLTYSVRPKFRNKRFLKIVILVMYTPFNRLIVWVFLETMAWNFSLARISGLLYSMKSYGKWFEPCWLDCPGLVPYCTRLVQ